MKSHKGRLLLTGFCLVLLASVCSCQPLDIQKPNTLVPATVSEDPRLPQIEIEVAGKRRRIHLETFGDTANPVLLVLHGSLGDYRALLPYQALSDRYFVVMWDQRGNGLSERIPEAEIGADYVVEEIRAVKQRFSPDRPVTLFGHSFGAMYTALYLSHHPADVRQAILAEPAGINSSSMAEAMRRSFKINLFDELFASRAWQQQSLSPRDHAQLDFLGFNIILDANEVRYHCDPANKPYWPTWRAGVYYDHIRGQKMMKGTKWNFDFAFGLGQYTTEVLILAGECSGIGPEYQREQILPLFPKARLVSIPNAGHRFVREAFPQVLAHIQEYLTEYP